MGPGFLPSLAELTPLIEQVIWIDGVTRLKVDRGPAALTIHDPAVALESRLPARLILEATAAADDVGVVRRQHVWPIRLVGDDCARGDERRKAGRRVLTFEEAGVVGDGF